MIIDVSPVGFRKTTNPAGPDLFRKIDLCAYDVTASFRRLTPPTRPRRAILMIERQMNDSRAMPTPSRREEKMLELLYIGRWDYLARPNLGQIAAVAPAVEVSPTKSEADKAAMENFLAEKAATARRS
jgi:hypothetical protein